MLISDVFIGGGGQGWIQSWTLKGPSDLFYCLFHVRSFLTLLFAIGNIAIWGAWPPSPIFSDICGIMGPKFKPKWLVPVHSLA